jgi:hypothetical protein
MNKPVSLAPLLPKGMAFARAAIAQAVSKGPAQAANYAQTRWGQDCLPSRIAKSAVSAVDAGDVGADVTAAAVEFMSAVRERSAIGQIANLRRRPARTRYLVNTGPMRGSWVAEGSAIPILPMSFEQNTLDLLKVASIVVLTDESLNEADAEAGIRRDLIDGMAAAIDTAFLDPDNAGTAGETPASITNGLTPISIGTGDQDDVRRALSIMIDEFEGDLTQAVFIGRPELFAMLNGYGYEDVGIRGGTLVGAPAIASRGLPNADGLYRLVLLDPGGIAYADDPTATQITASQNAAVEMRDDPTGSSTTPTPANLVSLFQTDCTAIKALAYANWSVEQAGAVAMMMAFPVAAVS